MAWCISAFGREEMAQVAIEEWAASSPIYTRRMQQALRLRGRPTSSRSSRGCSSTSARRRSSWTSATPSHDPWHGEFHLDHCGALMDVEPMGEDYVRSMCHDIEDPTFDATAVATNPRAQVRPIHRPPRTPRRPAPALRVDGDHRRVPPARCAPIPAPGHVVASTRAAALELDPIDPADEGAARLRRAAASPTSTSRRSRTRRWCGSPTRSASRCTCSTCASCIAVRARATSTRRRPPRSPPSSWSASPASPPSGSTARSASRRRRGRARVLELHPLLNPAAYVDASVDDCAADGRRRARPTTTAAGSRSAAPTRSGRSQADRPRRRPAPRRRGHRDRRPTGPRRSYAATSPAPESDEVAVTRFSTGASFTFEPRRSLPITPV